MAVSLRISPMRPDPRLPQALASAFVAGEMTVDAVVARSTRMLGREWRWLRPLGRRYIQMFSGRVRPRRRDVVEFLLQDKRFRRVSSKLSFEREILRRLTEPQRMQPVAAARKWEVPAIESRRTRPLTAL